MKRILSLLQSLFTGTPLKTAYPKESNSSIPLRQLVNQVMIGILPRTLQQKCFIVNDVENGVLVNNEKNIIADVIRRLLSTTIVYTKDNCIHVSANLSGNTTWLNINTNDSRQNWAISNSLRQVQSMTEKIGGCVTVINNKLSGITLAFAFSNQKQAA
ncbi:MAG: hypothetical protein WDO71_15675 [Bacteroidota bacterium]